jgi:hypothetical protein
MVKISGDLTLWPNFQGGLLAEKKILVNPLTPFTGFRFQNMVCCTAINAQHHSIFWIDFRAAYDYPNLGRVSRCKIKGN